MVQTSVICFSTLGNLKTYLCQDVHLYCLFFSLFFLNFFPGLLRNLYRGGFYRILTNSWLESAAVQARYRDISPWRLTLENHAYLWARILEMMSKVHKSDEIVHPQRLKTIRKNTSTLLLACCLRAGSVTKWHDLHPFLCFRYFLIKINRLLQKSIKTDNH